MKKTIESTPHLPPKQHLPWFDRWFTVWRQDLHSAAESGDLDLLNRFIQQGADVDKLNIAKSTPLICAVLHNHLACVERLLAAGANPNIVSSNLDGKTPLHLAVSANNLRLVELLVNNLAKIDIQDKYLVTPLEIARRHHFKPIISLLEHPVIKLSESSSGCRT